MEWRGERGLARCSFCGRGEDRGRRLVAGARPGVYICEECLRRCRDLLQQGGEDLRWDGRGSFLGRLGLAIRIPTRAAGGSPAPSSCPARRRR
ncbi:MAG TPA: ClpX C4-type zinc finger protein [Candidatus Dormibacteraeota bacterium]|nr:ClpX C4-type zinc finger protein [Candidatus Dormibacteraeota bacterium]